MSMRRTIGISLACLVTGACAIDRRPKRRAYPKPQITCAFPHGTLRRRKSSIEIGRHRRGDVRDLCGIAFAKEYVIERKWREARLYQTAPISTNLILTYIGQHVLGMPRSY
jgi:alkylation response protein AidB-like acyl-CoA dehydrogenase